MAAVRTMMSAVREEAAVISHEVTAVAKTEAIQSVKAAEGEVLNPLAIRRAVQATVQETTPKQTTLLSEHLAITKSIDAEAPLSNISNTTVTTTQTQSIIARQVENDLGMSVKDALVNASQAGVEDSVDLADVAKKLANKSAEAAAA